jgi:dihydropteroate synthase
MEEVQAYLRQGVGAAERAGVRQLLLDPGLGFGKSLGENYELLRRLGELRALGYPLLVGASRKSFIGKILDLPVEDRLEGSLAALAAAVIGGASVVRVHDVDASRRAAAVADAVLRGS